MQAACYCVGATQRGWNKDKLQLSSMTNTRKAAEGSDLMGRQFLGCLLLRTRQDASLTHLDAHDPSYVGVLQSVQCREDISYDVPATSPLH